MVILILIGSTFPIGPSEAAGDHLIDVGIGGRGSKYYPSWLVASPGDTVTWKWTYGEHDVFAYRGPGWESVSSGYKTSWSDPNTYSLTFQGGTLHYRCRLHAAVDSNGRCSGMCGEITDKTAPPPTPVITEPEPGQVLHRDSSDLTEIRGTAEPFSTVRLWEGGRQFSADVADENGFWSALYRPDSEYYGWKTVEARATYSDRWFHPPPEVPVSAGTTTYFRLKPRSDTVPPEGGIFGDLFARTVEPRFGMVDLAGWARDWSDVKALQVEFRPWEGEPFSVPVECQPACPSLEVNWSLRRSVPPGGYDIRLRMTDVLGNSSVSRAAYRLVAPAVPESPVMPALFDVGEVCMEYGNPGDSLFTPVPFCMQSGAGEPGAADLARRGKLQVGGWDYVYTQPWGVGWNPWLAGIYSSSATKHHSSPGASKLQATASVSGVMFGTYERSLASCLKIKQNGTVLAIDCFANDASRSDGIRTLSATADVSAGQVSVEISLTTSKDFGYGHLSVESLDLTTL